MCLHKMDHIIAPPFCEYQELKIKDLYERLDEATLSVKNTLAFQTAIVKEEGGPPSVVEKEVSKSLKKHWMTRKTENGAAGSNINNEKKMGPQISPRSPKIMAKSPTTHRDFDNNSPKK